MPSSAATTRGASSRAATPRSSPGSSSGGTTSEATRQLVPRLLAAGHQVHGMTRSESKPAILRELGTVPVIADALDHDQVTEAVAHAKPDVIVHQLTAIPAGLG